MGGGPGPRSMLASSMAPSSHPCRERLADQSGQAVVEAAIILPSMVFLLLVAIQLMLLQQARIMVEYAAFCAARVGIVRNMDNGKDGMSGPMRDAAAFAVLPSFGRTDDFTRLTATFARFEAQDAPMRLVGLPMVRVAVLNPRKRDFANLGQHLNGQELDFDDVRPQAAAANLLSVQVRYLFELKVPFANKMIQAIWFATQLGVLGTWSGFDMSRPMVGSERGPNALGVTETLALGRGSIADGMPGGLSVSALALLARTNRFYLPVNAWYTMRMQSNPYARFAP